MKIQPATQEAYQLFHEGMLALANVEANGIRIDTSYLDEQIDVVGKQIKEKEAELKETAVWRVWKKRHRDKAKLGSKQQLAQVFFGEFKYPRGSRGKLQDEDAFDHIDNPFIKDYFEIEKLKKLKGTYLLGLKREVCDGFLHPFFNLHTVKTYRGSSDRINFQNIPVRNQEIADVIRRAFIPRDGHVIVEIDYGGLEFCMAGSITNDPAIKRYIEGKGDPHRDMAALVFDCKPEEVTKKMRYCGKNQFVFPVLYGSYYISCAPVLWQSAQELEFADGRSVAGHLEGHDIIGLGDLDPKQKPEPGTFEYHLKECEREYTQVRFKKCFDVQRKAYEDYCKTGFIKFVTGFVASGLLSRNDVYNWRIQGPAFHCLLWSLIRLNRWLVKSKFRSRIVGQIHDSIVGDIHVDEFEDFVQYAEYVMTDEIRRHWPWLTVPLSIEVEVTPEDAPWNEKKPYKI